MKKHDYGLKASRIKPLLHGLLLIVMVCLWMLHLTVLGVTLLSILAVIGYWFYAVQAQALRVAQLDADVWTVEWSKSMLSWWDWIRLDRSISTTQRADSVNRGTPAQPKLQTKPTQTIVKHQQLEQVLDHALYMVLRFQKAPTVIIWRDQVTPPQWKQLKILAKLN